MNEVYFDIPYSSFKKDFLDTYSDELTENLFLHLLPYIIAQPQELNLYKMLISFDIKDSILYGLSDDIKARFLSASAQHKKSIHIGDNDTKNSYKIYFAEYSAYEKYCRLNDDEGIAYGFTYKDLDTFMEKKYHLLLSIYFTVQNLIRLACHQSKLYSLDNAQILSDITDENDDNNGAANNTDTQGNVTDKTTANKVLPAAGLKTMFLPAIILIVIAFVSYNKYKKYKDI